MPTRQTTEAITLKLFPNTILLLKVHQFKRYSNQNQINTIMSNHVISCSMHQANFELQEDLYSYTLQYKNDSNKLTTFYILLT